MTVTMSPGRTLLSVSAGSFIGSRSENQDLFVMRRISTARGDSGSSSDRTGTSAEAFSYISQCSLTRIDQVDLFHSDGGEGIFGDILLVAVLDGHGIQGRAAARIVADQLLHLLERDPQFTTSLCRDPAPLETVIFPELQAWLSMQPELPALDTHACGAANIAGCDTPPGSCLHFDASFLGDLQPSPADPSNKSSSAETPPQEPSRSLSASSFFDPCLSGTTLSLALFIPTDPTNLSMVFAHVGDTSSILGSVKRSPAVAGASSGTEKWFTSTLTEQHNWDNPAEAGAVLQAGAPPADSSLQTRGNGSARIARSTCPVTGQEYGPLRIFRKTENIPGLAMSRALGDTVAQALGVTARPTIRLRPLVQATSPAGGEGTDIRVDRFVILATDGVWDVVTPKTAFQVARKILRKRSPPAGCSEHIVTSLLKDVVCATRSERDTLDAQGATQIEGEFDNATALCVVVSTPGAEASCNDICDNTGSGSVADSSTDSSADCSTPATSSSL
ncbi:hypothetical protein H696_02865 [Fonticula alba]|uniref:PPM-type phosphatase domain-containing protein n=1 Tax=Fonticula alba TaxID=691883 RepID=A0A058Z8W2_FONAL|nr:hypothetical protein H696_02865 [Fonticula alba]KCV70516.1 hypothetical protein H696_02865 [Fonticula alba]|eukprot:XP_009495032.1 hypothetical protein H696_02865 [Fonticula alba]